MDGIYFALPTRAAATQIHERVARFVERMFPEGNRPEPVLAVPGYVKASDITGHHLQNYKVWWDGHAAARNRRWAAASPMGLIGRSDGNERRSPSCPPIESPRRDGAALPSRLPAPGST